MSLKQPPSTEIERMIHMVWNDIGYDVMDMGDCTNEAAIECCIDANRPSSFHGQKGQEVEDTLRALYAEHTYPKVLKWLSKHIHLV
jgi:hypothetical protein